MSGSVFAKSDPKCKDKSRVYYVHLQVPIPRFQCHVSRALGNNTDLKADRLGYNPGSTQSRCDLGQIS